MMERTLAPSSRRFATSLLSGELALIVAVVVVWLVVAARFASAQEIWVDETTQLSGLTLGPMEVVGWLGGDRQDRFDVPGDRMPPVSYWLGSAWASLFGATENSLRALGIVLVGAAAALIASAAHRAWGSLAGWISGIAFALSPNAILSGVEIRAYPLLIFLSAVAFWLMVALEDVECVRRPSRWVALAATCIVAAYTHFFGLVLAGAVFLGLLAFDSVRKEGRAYWLLGTGMIAVASVGLLPFIRAAMNISPSGTEPKEVLPGVVRLAYRTLGGHPALAVYWPVLVAGLTGALIVLAAVPLPKRRARVGHALALSLGAGFIVVTGVKAVTASFEALSISYNSWMMPAVFIAMGSVAALEGTRGRWIRVGGTGLLWAGSAAGAFVLLSNRPTFAHTAAERMAERIRAAGHSDLAVVHDGGGVWGHSYFPLRFTFGRSLRQFVAEPGSDGKVVFKALPRLEPVADSAALGPRVLWVTSRHQHTDELTAYVRSGRLLPAPSESRLRALPERRFRVERSETLMAYVASDMVWLRSRD